MFCPKGAFLVVLKIAKSNNLSSEQKYNASSPLQMFFCYSIYYDSWLYCHPLIVVVLLVVVVVVDVAVTVLPLEELTWMRG